MVLRSLLYNTLFYLNLVVWLVVAIPTFAMPRMAIVRVAQAWGAVSVWLLRVVVGTRVEIRGRQHLRPGPLLVAAKHQSFVEILALLPLFSDPTFILKRELTWIPLFGWFTLKARMISVDRLGGSAALAAMNERARQAARDGRQILIFPEGTRRPPGAEPAYKGGTGHLYRSLAVPCLPVAVNSGVFWPRRKFLRRPGTLVVEFLPAIEPGLDRKTFTARLETAIETASDRLLAEARAPTGYLGPDGI